MSSSDSEDDSFLNIARKLSAIKRDFRLDDVETTKNDYKPLESATSSPSKSKKNKKSPAKKGARLISTESDSSGSIDLDAFRSAFPPLNEAKRKTRASKRKAAHDSPNLADLQLCLPRRRKKNTSTSAGTSEIAENSSNANVNVSPPNRGRGRGKARGRGRKARNSSRSSLANATECIPSIMDVLRSMVPVYSVGNTDEYPDQCDNQQLFGSRKENIPVQEEIINDSLEDNEEFSVKVYWQSSDYFKFQIRKYQKFTIIYDFFAQKENVSYDKLLFTYKDKILTPEDTPDSIDYSVAKFIDGGVVNQSVTHLTSNSMDVKDGVKLKFQCQNVKKLFEIFVKPDDKLSSAMMRCAEHFEKPIDKLRFEFDGDFISGKSTPKELELEGGECIDVKILG